MTQNPPGSEPLHRPYKDVFPVSTSRLEVEAAQAWANASVATRQELGDSTALTMVIKNHPAALQEILAAGADPDQYGRGEPGNHDLGDVYHMPLQWAARHGYLECMDVLLAHGVSQDSRDTALWELAVDWTNTPNRVGVAERLVASGITERVLSIAACFFCSEYRVLEYTWVQARAPPLSDDDRRQQLTILTMLGSAGAVLGLCVPYTVKDGNLLIVRYLVQQVGMTVVLDIVSSLWRVLDLSNRVDARCTLEALEKEWVHELAGSARLKWRELHYEVDVGNDQMPPDVAEYVHLVNAILLSRMRREGSIKPEEMKQLLRSSPEVLRAFLNESSPTRKGIQAILADYVDDDGGTLLHAAMRDSPWPLVRYLIRTAGLDINTSDRRGWTPLHVACSRRLIELSEIQGLVDAGADTRATTKEGYIFLHVLTMYWEHFDLDDQEEWLRRIIPKAQVNVNKPISTALSWSKSDRSWSFLGAQQEDTIERTVDAHLATEQPGTHRLDQPVDGVTALHIAAERGCFRVAASLILAGAIVDARDSNDDTPLLRCVKSMEDNDGYNQALDPLINAGADVEAKDRNGVSVRQWGSKLEVRYDFDRREALDW